MALKRTANDEVSLSISRHGPRELIMHMKAELYMNLTPSIRSDVVHFKLATTYCFARSGHRYLAA